MEHFGPKINTFMNQVFFSKTFEFQLNRLYKYTCWTSDRHTRFLLGYRNMHDRNQLKLESHSILTKKSFCPAIGGAGPPLSTPVGPRSAGVPRAPMQVKTDMSTPLLLEVAPEIDSDPTSFTGGGIEGSRSASRPLL